MLKPLEISQERVRDLFDCRDGRLYWKHREDVVGRGWNARWVGKEAGATPKYNGYHNVKIDGVFYRRCRLVWIWHNGEIAAGQYVDHVNCDRGDDSIENLRICTSSQNSYNRSSYPITYSGPEAKVKQVMDFFDRHAGAKAFLWTTPLGQLGLFTCKNPVPTPVGGGVFKLTATFERAFHP